MKRLSESQKKTIKEFLAKKHKLNEGIIDYIFGKVLVNKLKNDKNFVKLAKDLDKKLEVTKWILQKSVDKNQPVPDDVMQIVNKGGRYD